MVRVLLFALTAASMPAWAAPPADWNVVARLAPGTRVQVYPIDRAKPEARGTVVSASANSLVVSGKSGEVSLQSLEIKLVKIAAPQRRVRNGLLGLAIGGGAGIAAGVAICPYCRNEGHTGFEGAGAAIGAGFGALVFLPTPYQTIYKAPRK